MKTFSIIIIASIASALVTSCSSNKKPKPDEVNTVYICTGINATAYHANDQCSSLSNCSGEIKRIGIDLASITRHPCKLCFDTSSVSDTQDEENDQYDNSVEKRVKKYVYLDRNNVLHYSLDCEVLQPFVENHQEEYAISFIEVENANLESHWYCARCFTNKRYEEICNRLPAISDTIIGQLSQNADLKTLYSALKADGAPLPDTYEEFANYMTSGPKHGYEHRKEVYEALKADGAPLPETYEEFSKAYFVSKDTTRGLV